MIDERVWLRVVHRGLICLTLGTREPGEIPTEVEFDSPERPKPGRTCRAWDAGWWESAVEINLGGAQSPGWRAVATGAAKTNRQALQGVGATARYNE